MPRDDMQDDGTVIARPEDDLMTRAEKIVHVLGYRGAVGGFVINVYRLLQAYEKADRAAALHLEQNKTGASPT